MNCLHSHGSLRGVIRLMNMEIILRGWKGVCWDLGVLLECARPGFLQTPCAEVMGRLGPKQPLGKRPGQVWEPVQLEQGLRHVGPVASPEQSRGPWRCLGSSVTAMRHYLCLRKGTWFSSNRCGTGVDPWSAGTGLSRSACIVPASSTAQQHSPASRCLPNTNEVVSQFLGVEHSSPCSSACQIAADIPLAPHRCPCAAAYPGHGQQPSWRLMMDMQSPGALGLGCPAAACASRSCCSLGCPAAAGLLQCCSGPPMVTRAPSARAQHRSPVSSPVPPSHKLGHGCHHSALCSAQGLVALGGALGCCSRLLCIHPLVIDRSENL